MPLDEKESLSSMENRSQKGLFNEWSGDESDHRIITLRNIANASGFFSCFPGVINSCRQPLVMNRVLRFPPLESPFMFRSQRAQLASMVAIGKNVGVITINTRDASARVYISNTTISEQPNTYNWTLVFSTASALDLRLQDFTISSRSILGVSSGY